MIDRARFLRRAGYSVLLIDFQATGEAKGDHITFGWRESRDVLAAINLVHHIDPADQVAIIGSSLGGVAALLATPPLKVDALVLEEVYPTIEIATRNRIENYLGAFGRILTPVLLNQLRWRLGVSASQLRPVDHIANVECRCSSSAEKKTKTQDHPTHRCWFSVRDPPKKFGSCQTLDMSICTEQRGRNMKHESWLFLLRWKNRQKIRNHEVSLPNRNVFRADQVYSFLFASFACSVG